MEHNLPPAAKVGLAEVVMGAVVRPPALGSWSPVAPQSNSALAAQQWIPQLATTLTTSQFVVCAGIAWCIFVLSLILLARSKRDVPREHKPQHKQTEAANPADAVPTHLEP